MHACTRACVHACTHSRFPRWARRRQSASTCASPHIPSSSKAARFLPPCAATALRAGRRRWERGPGNRFRLHPRAPRPAARGPRLARACAGTRTRSARPPAAASPRARAGGRGRSAAAREGGGAAVQPRARGPGLGCLGNSGRGRQAGRPWRQRAARSPHCGSWGPQLFSKARVASGGVAVAEPHHRLPPWAWAPGEPLRTAGRPLGRDRPRCALLSLSPWVSRGRAVAGAGVRALGQPSPGRLKGGGGEARGLLEARSAGQPCATRVELGLRPAAGGCGCELLRSTFPLSCLVQAGPAWCSGGRGCSLFPFYSPFGLKWSSSWCVPKSIPF